jgi:hypothetical protein
MGRARPCRTQGRIVIALTLSVLALVASPTSPPATPTAAPLPLVPRPGGRVPVAPGSDGAPFVQVHSPVDMRAGFVTTAPSADGMYYVTIADAAAINTSNTDFGWYEPSDFHLLADGKVYYPVVRPNLGAVDLSSTGSVPPLGTVVATVTFKVPRTVASADFEFIPKNWFNSWGGSQVFCCLYQL